MKRLEIVVDTPHLERLLSRLRDAGAKGYTVLPNASGFGDRGTQRGDDPSGVSGNTCVLLAVPVEDAKDPRSHPCRPATHRGHLSCFRLPVAGVLVRGVRIQRRWYRFHTLLMPMQG